MNDKFIDDLLDKPIPKSDSNAKKIAINLARSEFSQGIPTSTRPIDDESTMLSIQHSPSWRKVMIFLNSPRNIKAFTTAAIAFVALSVAFLLPNREISLNESAAVVDKHAATQDKLDSLTPSVPPENVDTIEELEETVVIAQPRATPPPQAAPQQEHSLAFNKQTTTINAAIGPTQNSPTAESEPSSDSILDDDSAIKSRETPRAKSGSLNAAIGKNVGLDPRRDSSNTAMTAGKTTDVTKPANHQIFFPTVPDSQITPTDPDKQSEPSQEYLQHLENTVKMVREDPLSTFSIDVDTASYSLARNHLLSGNLPHHMAIRSEEMINYFNYSYPLPRTKKQPFKASTTVLNSPWNKDKKLLHIGIKGYDIPKTETPSSNLVFLLDVSGSMNQQDKLPLVKKSIKLLLDTLKPTDTVSIVVYAGAAGTVLEPTKVRDKNKIIDALKNLNAGGSTAGGQGISLAYRLAEQNFDDNAVNRIILATDGDFNVGLRSNEALKRLVEEKRNKGVFLSVLGFGRHNYKDDMMQTLAQNGNGIAAYIDSLSEAKKVLLDEATSTLFTIAKDVKIQIEFNPAAVKEYRLIGYETRHLNREDFNNDKVDAGDIGAGHTVTAIYEITPTGSEKPSIDELRYNENAANMETASNSNEYGFLKIRYKLPDSSESKLIEQAIQKTANNFAPKEVMQEIQFSVAVAGFAQLLKGGRNTGDITFDDIIELARRNKGEDLFGYRSEFINLVGMAKIARP